MAEGLPPLLMLEGEISLMLRSSSCLVTSASSDLLRSREALPGGGYWGCVEREGSTGCIGRVD